MITAPTLLILGAGASVPYKYPSGVGLLKLINAFLDKQIDPRYAILKELDFDDSTIKSFRNELCGSGLLSIDEFLINRSEYANLGKYVIALSLMGHEVETYLFSYDDDNWYRELYRKLNCDFDSLSKHNLSIITFNYDRSLEQFLFLAIKNSHNRSDADCANVVTSFNIKHIHGKLGELPWESSNSKEFSHRLNIEDIKKAAKGIRIINEVVANNDELSKIHNIIERAEHIYFIGFSYNPINLKTLRLSCHQSDFLLNPKINKNIWGSAFGLEDTQKNEAKEHLNNRIKFSGISEDAKRFFLKYVNLR